MVAASTTSPRRRDPDHAGGGADGPDGQADDAAEDAH
jgi:hypothetical protein